MSQNKLVDQARQLAKELIELRRNEEAESLTGDECALVMAEFIRTINVSVKRDHVADHDLFDEIAYRSLSCLAWVDGDLLLEEMDRRRLPVVKAGMSQAEFQKAAKQRGFKRSLQEFPKREILNYLKVQGLLQPSPRC